MAARLIAAALRASIEVSGDASCPSVDDVRARVEQLSSELGLDHGQQLTAQLNRAADEDVDLTLLASDGRVLAQKTFPGKTSCDELVLASSLVIVTWARAFEVPAMPDVAPPPRLPQEDLDGDTPERPALEPTRQRFTFDVGASLSASVGAGPVSVGAGVHAALASVRTNAGARIALLALGAHRAPMTASTWERYAFVLSAFQRFEMGWLVGELHADALGALLSVVSGNAGLSYASFDPGFSAGLRVSGAMAFLDASVIGWPLPRAIDSRDSLPRAELLLSTGLHWSEP